MTSKFECPNALDINAIFAPLESKFLANALLSACGLMFFKPNCLLYFVNCFEIALLVDFVSKGVAL